MLKSWFLSYKFCSLDINVTIFRFFLATDLKFATQKIPIFQQFEVQLFRFICNFLAQSRLFCLCRKPFCDDIKYRSHLFFELFFSIWFLNYLSLVETFCKNFFCKKKPITSWTLFFCVLVFFIEMPNFGNNFMSSINDVSFGKKCCHKWTIGIVACSNESAHGKGDEKSEENCMWCNLNGIVFERSVQLSAIHAQSSFQKLFASELISRGISVCRVLGVSMPFWIFQDFPFVIRRPW